MATTVVLLQYTKPYCSNEASLVVLPLCIIDEVYRMPSDDISFAGDQATSVYCMLSSPILGGH